MQHDRIEAVRPPPRNHGDRADGQPQRGRDAAPRAARLRREDLSRRLRDRLLVAEPPAQAAGRRAQDRSLVREEPAAARTVRRSSRASWRWRGRSTPAWSPKASRATCRRASWSASAARTRRATCSRGRCRPRAVEALLVANRPLGPKRTEPAVVAAAADAVPVHSSTPFEWPAHIPVRPVAAAAAHASTPHASGETLRA